MNRFVVLLGIATMAATTTTHAKGGGGGGHADPGMSGAERAEAVAATSAEAIPAPPGTENVAQNATSDTSNTHTKKKTHLKDAPAPAPKTIYLSIGGGIDITSKHANSTLSSGNLTYNPGAGLGVFSLPSVTWRNRYSTGYDANIAIGNLITSNMRIEAEFLYQNIKRHVTGVYDFTEVRRISGDNYGSSYNNPIGQTSTRASVYSLLGNGYYDFHNKTKWTPFVGAGIGVAWIHSPKTTFTTTLALVDTTTDTTTNVPVVANSPALSGAAFAYQVKAGIAYEMTQRAALALQYRYFGTTEFQASSSSIKVQNASFPIGLQNTSSLGNNTIDLTLRYLVW